MVGWHQTGPISSLLEQKSKENLLKLNKAVVRITAGGREHSLLGLETVWSSPDFASHLLLLDKSFCFPGPFSQDHPRALKSQITRPNLRLFDSEFLGMGSSNLYHWFLFFYFYY